MFPLRPSTRSQAASGPDNLQKARSVAGTLPKRYFSQAVEPALRESLLCMTGDVCSGSTRGCQPLMPNGQAVERCRIQDVGN